jgi:hypothetical protein
LVAEELSLLRILFRRISAGALYTVYLPFLGR